MDKAEKIKTIKEIILNLENVAERPYLYLGKEDENLLVAFLIGFEFACDLHGTVLDGVREIEKERGWHSQSPAGIWTVMRQQGLSSKETIREMLTIRILAWKRLLAELEAQEL